MELEQAWPPFGLKLQYEDLLLREATDQDVLALAEIVDAGIVEPGNEHFMPRLLLDRAATEQQRAANFLMHFWGRRHNTTPDKWDLAFVVAVDGEVVGSQSIHTHSFPLLREVHSGSYLKPAMQGRGIGTRMRAMVLELSFGYFGARWACSGYAPGNVQSERVSSRLGYEPDGIENLTADGRSIETHRLRLSRERWFEHRPEWLDDVELCGVDEVRSFLGIA